MLPQGFKNEITKLKNNNFGQEFWGTSCHQNNNKKDDTILFLWCLIFKIKFNICATTKSGKGVVFPQISGSS